LESSQSVSSNSQKVLILSLGRYGGCVRYATEIVDAMELDYEVYVSSYSKEKVPKIHRKTLTYKSNIQFLFSLFTVFPLLWLKILCGLLRGRYSAVYFPYKHYWNLSFLWLFKLFGKKTVMTIHDGILHEGEENRLQQILLNQCIKHADELIFLTDFVRKNVQATIGFTANYTIIEHGMFTDYVHTQARTHTHKPRLLFLGRIGKYKGVEMLAEAVNQLLEDSYESLTIAGKTLYDLEIKTENPKIISLDKWLNDNEVSQLLKESDILILPYKEASQSGVIPMGVAAAIPMVCTRVGGLPEQLKEDEAILVKPNVEALKKGISRLICDSDLYENLSKKMLKKQSELTWKSIAKRIEKVISK